MHREKIFETPVEPSLRRKGGDPKICSPVGERMLSGEMCFFLFLPRSEPTVVSDPKICSPVREREVSGGTCFFF